MCRWHGMLCVNSGFPNLVRVFFLSRFRILEMKQDIARPSKVKCMAMKSETVLWGKRRERPKAATKWTWSLCNNLWNLCGGNMGQQHVKCDYKNTTSINWCMIILELPLSQDLKRPASALPSKLWKGSRKAKGGKGSESWSRYLGWTIFQM